MSLRAISLHHFKLLISLFCCLLVVFPAHAQTPTGQLQTGDVIGVVVTNHPEMSVDPVTVGANGRIQLPFAGSIIVAGKTIPQTAEAISNALRRQLRNPRVTVILRQTRPERVFVLGSVQKPGAYDMPAGGGVAEALALAGGAAPRAALSQATIKRADGTVIPVDLQKAPGQPAVNIPLEAGDVLMVPESQARITVRGAVAKPGVYDVADGASMPVSEALSLAGGATAKSALSKAQLTRADGTIVPVDLFKAVAQGQPEANILMAPGDTLSVPLATGLTVLGAVQKPGVLSVEAETLTLTEALAQAGGLTVPPAQARISISRMGADGQTQVSTVDPVSLLSLRDPAQNIRLNDGDLVSVASKEAQTVFISGEVKNPGAYEIREGDSIAELIVRAGGPTPLASLTRVSVVNRGGTAQTINTAAPILEGGSRAQDFPLQQGDFVVVPQNKAVVLVLGAVQQPGKYPVPETGTFTLGDALAAAGGARDRAKVKEILLLRQDPNTPGQAGLQRQIVSMHNTVNGQLTLNQPLQSGTIVYVPEGKDPNSGWQRIFGTLTALAALVF